MTLRVSNLSFWSAGISFGIGWVSSKYSHIGVLSVNTATPSFNKGTLPDGLNLIKSKFCSQTGSSINSTSSFFSARTSLTFRQKGESVKWCSFLIINKSQFNPYIIIKNSWICHLFLESPYLFLVSKFFAEVASLIF